MNINWKKVGIGLLAGAGIGLGGASIFSGSSLIRDGIKLAKNLIVGEYDEFTQDHDLSIGDGVDEDLREDPPED